MFDELVKKAQEVFPDLKIEYKDESTLMKIIGKILFFNPQFMSNYITTLGSTVYFPSRLHTKDDEFGDCLVLLHELVHIHDSKKMGIEFGMLYALPQLAALLAIPALLFSWKLALFFLIFLLPIPSYFRAQFELRGYTMSMYARFKFANVDPTQEVDFYLKQFNTAAYYFMWPFPSFRDKLMSIATAIKNGEKPLLEQELYDMADNLIK